MDGRVVKPWSPFPRIGSSHWLNDAEQRLAQHLADQRNKASTAAGAHNGRRSSFSDYTIALHGAASEIAFCRIHNAYPDTEVVTRGRWPEWDTILYGGITVEVKSTTYPNGKLLLPVGLHKETDQVDVYGLMVGTFPGPYRLAGFMDRAELVRPERITDPGRGPAYTATQSELIELGDWYLTTKATPPPRGGAQNV